MAETKREYPKMKRCPRCVRVPPGQSHRKPYHPAMNSMYIKITSKGCLVKVGWFCRNCGKMMGLRKMDCLNEG